MRFLAFQRLVRFVVTVRATTNPLYVVQQQYPLYANPLGRFFLGCFLHSRVNTLLLVNKCIVSVSKWTVNSVLLDTLNIFSSAYILFCKLLIYRHIFKVY